MVAWYDFFQLQKIAAVVGGKLMNATIYYWDMNRCWVMQIYSIQARAEQGTNHIPTT